MNGPSQATVQLVKKNNKRSDEESQENGLGQCIVWLTLVPATRLDMFPYLDMPAPGARRDLAVNGAKRNADRLCSFFFFFVLNC